MSKPCFYLPPEQWGPKMLLQGQEARHLAQVLRMGPGEEVALLDGCGRKGLCRIEAATKREVRLSLLSESRETRSSSLAIMALAFSKAVRRGFFMEKAVELGAHAVWLWQGERSQGKLSQETAQACLGQMIAGAKQSSNPWLPEVRALMGGVDELVRLAGQADRRILPWEAQTGLPMLTAGMAGQSGLTVYAIGPEGGFSERELAALEDGGFSTVSLGARVLRCETAATLCLGIHWWAAQLPDHADELPAARG
ncbi:MAG: 16S rRNA (uracil(1498)-N(3))-methyltransferase [Desulfovibrionaceae bacterium]|nr:16S rRNA (uracil(1498)-N(3))-methyltransferase [Desulfovibrionaceae bacterium]